MAYLGNTPPETTILRVEARKSFTLRLNLKDRLGWPLPLSESSIHFVAKALPLDTDDSTDATNLITNSLAVVTDPDTGSCTFNFQASDLDHKPGEYPYSIVLIKDGYSSVLVKGILDIQQNTEFLSVGETYSSATAPESLDVILRANMIVVKAGPVLPPGAISFTQADWEKLNTLWNERNE